MIRFKGLTVKGQVATWGKMKTLHALADDSDGFTGVHIWKESSNFPLLGLRHPLCSAKVCYGFS